MSTVTIELVSGSCAITLPCSLLKHMDYFTALLEAGMKETNERRVVFAEDVVTPTALQLIAAYLKDGDFAVDTFTLRILSDLASASSYLQMSHNLNKLIIDEIVSNRISFQTCDEVDAAFAGIFGYEAVCRGVSNCRNKEFMQYYRTYNFLQLELDDTVALLKSDELVADSELDVVKAIAIWFAHFVNTLTHSQDKSMYEMQAAKLLDCTRCLMLSGSDIEYLNSEDFRKEYIDKIKCKKPSVISDQEIRNLFASKLKACIDKAGEMKTNDKLLYGEFGPETRFRNTETVLLAVGGFRKDGNKAVNCVETFKLPPAGSRRASETTLTLTFVPTPSPWRLPETMCEHCVCVVGSVMYVMGGQHNYYNNGRGTTNRCFRFDPRLESWSEIASMAVPRSLFCACVLNRKLYAVGGWVAPEKTTRTMEVFDPVDGTWTYSQPLDYSIHEHRGCTVGGKLYISGGFKNPLVGQVAWLEAYDPGEETWRSLAPMQEARSYHVMLEWRGGILVCGGVQQIERRIFQDIHTCELYNVSTDQWTLLPCTLPLPASCMSWHLHGSLLYVFGGYTFGSEDENFLTSHSQVQVLDLETSEWVCPRGQGQDQTKVTMKNKGRHFECVALQLPKHFLQ